MKYLKSFRFWIAFVLVTYTFVGFIGLPWFLSNKTAPLLKEKIGLHVEIGKTTFNPFSFRLEINDVLLKDLKDKPVLGFKKIFIDYIPLGLIEDTWLFRKLEITSPKIYATIEEDGKINFENILPPTKEDDSQEETSTKLPIITLQKFSITDGNIKFSDLRAKKTFDLNFGPYNFNAHDISTKKDALNAHNFVTKINKSGELFWEGGVRLNPMKIYGKIRVKELELPEFYSYAFPDFNAVLQQGKINLQIPYQVDLSNELKFSINDAVANISDVVFTNQKNRGTLISLKNLNVDGLDFKWPQKTIGLTKVEINEPYISMTLDKNREFTIVKSFSSKAQTKYKKIDKSKPSKWDFLVQDISINKGNFTFIDDMGDKPIQSDITNLNINVKEITQDSTKAINYALNATLNKTSTLDSQGEVIVKPFNLKSNVELKSFDLTNYVNYAKPYINFLIKDAKISSKTKVDLSYQDSLNLNVLGDVNINNLLLHTNDNKKLLAWKSLDINGVHYIHNPMKLDIKDFQLDEPYIRAHVAKNGTTNFSGLIKEDKTKQKQMPKKQSKKKSDLKVKIGPMKLTNGISDFSDFSLPFPFQTHIHDLQGSFSTLDFGTTTPSELSLIGQIDKYGYTDIRGKLSPLNFKQNASLSLLFKNIDLTSLTPYSSKFVGYKIKQGKLSMDLKYAIDKSNLLGENKINIDTLILGEVVDSPDATSLPLELAIALLKDSDGQIDIDMPVQGDINAPDFSYGGVVWGAIGNMITGIVTAPFRILGNMLGVSEDELKSIDFDKGSAKLITTEYEKLDNLNKILSKRPGIKLNISGGYDKVFDKYELQKQKFKTQINKELRSSKKTDEDIYGTALKSIYVREFSNKKYDDLKKEFVIKEDDNKTKKSDVKFDIVAFNNSLQKEITIDIKIEQKEFENLANQRANSIKTEFVTKYKIDAKRLEVLPPKPKEAKRDRWIESELDIAI